MRAQDESHTCLETLFAQLGSTRAATRKRAISCIASLSAALPDRLLAQVKSFEYDSAWGIGLGHHPHSPPH